MCQRTSAGTTGENMTTALSLLCDLRPDLFPSADRTHYRITNAFAHPLARSLGHTRTEATKGEVLAVENISRVLTELDGCSLILLCGTRATWLLPHVSAVSGRHTVAMSHLSNQALASKHNTVYARNRPTSTMRRRARVQSWVQDAINKLP